MRTFAAAVVVLLPITEVMVSAQEATFELRVPNGLHRCVLIEQKEFNRERVEAISRTFLNENRSLPVLKLSIVTNRRDSAIALCGKCMYDYPFSVWLRLRRQWLLEHGPVAEMIAINGNAVLRVRDRAGDIQRVVLAGNDPLRVRVAGTAIEILHIAFPSAEGVFRSRETLEFYARRSGPLSLNEAVEVTRVLRDATGGRIDLSVRADSWFVASEHFPIVSIFEPITEPPRYESLVQNKTIYCIGAVRDVRCAELTVTLPP